MVNCRSPCDESIKSLSLGTPQHLCESQILSFLPRLHLTVVGMHTQVLCACIRIFPTCINTHLTSARFCYSLPTVCFVLH